MKNKSNKNNKKVKNLKGFSLTELVVVLIVSGIMLSSFIVMFREFMRTHRRQERTMLIERSLEATEVALKDSLTSLPGRGLATSNGSLYSIPLLPFAGSIPSGSINKPIRLGIITPYRINENDAFTLIYSDTTIPRLPLDAQVVQIGSSKIVRVPLPNTSSTKQTNLGSIGKGGVPIDEVPSPDSNPNNTSSSIPRVDMFQPGQMMLIIESPSFIDGTTQPKQPVAILVRLTNVIRTTGNNREFLQFTLDVCEGGSCGQLTNDPTAGNISAGSILVPVKFTSFYLKKDSFGNKVVRNDDGLILPNGSGFSINGGTETIVGESDFLTVNYHLRNGSIVSTPANPIVAWINDVFSVDILIASRMPGTQATEYFDRSRKINFPIVSRNLE